MCALKGSLQVIGNNFIHSIGSPSDESVADTLTNNNIMTFKHKILGKKSFLTKFPLPTELLKKIDERRG